MILIFYPQIVIKSIFHLCIGNFKFKHSNNFITKLNTCFLIDILKFIFTFSILSNLKFI